MKTNKPEIPTINTYISRCYVILISLCPFVLSGCATVFCGSTKEVEFKTYPSGTEIYASTPDNQSGIYLGISPLTADVPRETRTLIIKKSGYKVARIHSGRRFSFFPLILDIIYWPTIFVDAYTGSCYTLKDSHDIILQKEDVK